MKRKDSLGYLLAGMMVLWWFGAAGCALRPAAVVPALQPQVRAPGHGQSGWWAVRFQLDWPPGGDPAWHLDALMAHQVVAPVLKNFDDKIFLWRFHRRASRDKTGHQFSFIFYGTPATAMDIVTLLRSDSRLARLKQDGVVNQITYSDTDHIGKPKIADTADPNWSEPVQRAWPYFIMGASRMWLELVEDIASRTDGGQVPDDLAEQLDFFRKVNGELTRTWQDEGRHALLHHLNALFGYGPLVVYEKRYLQF